MKASPRPGDHGALFDGASVALFARLRQMMRDGADAPAPDLHRDAATRSQPFSAAIQRPAIQSMILRTPDR